MNLTDRHYMNYASILAAGSKDTGRKTSCVIVKARVIASGVNDFQAGTFDTPERRERPAKYAYTEHAERNAIYDCARLGEATAGGTIYSPWFPCVDCARAIVGAGLVRLVCVEPDWTEARYFFREALAIMRENGVQVDFVPVEIAR